MFLVESKYIPETGTLILTPNNGLIQYDMNNDTVLCEQIIPLVHSMDDAPELSVVLEPFFKKWPILVIDDKYIHFDTISYVYKKGEIITWGTRLPKLIGIIKSPFYDTDETECKIKTNEGYITFETKSFIFSEKNLFRVSEFKEGVYINIQILNNIFKQHKNKFVKIFLEEEFPICLEFIDITNTRYYVAPLGF